MPALTLTAVQDAVWNGPFHQRLDFEVLAPSEIDPDLAFILSGETSRGLPAWRRHAMRFTLKRS